MLLYKHNFGDGITYIFPHKFFQKIFAFLSKQKVRKGSPQMFCAILVLRCRFINQQTITHLKHNQHHT